MMEENMSCLHVVTEIVHLKNIRVSKNSILEWGNERQLCMELKKISEYSLMLDVSLESVAED